MALAFLSRRVLVVAALAVTATGCSLGGTEPPEAITVANPRTATYSAAFVPPIVINQMTVRDSGLFIQDLVVGTGDSIVTAADTSFLTNNRLQVLYRLWLSTGAQVDSSRNASAPFTPRMRPREIIEGWRAGLLGMRVGGRRRLVLSPLWGYGFTPIPDGRGGTLIPANSILIFDVELLGITRS